MARPRKDKEHKLSKVVVIRLSETELKQLQIYSESCGQPVGTLVRVKLFTGRFPDPLMPKTDHLLYVELNRIGNNINQLARRANSGFMYRQHTQSLIQALDKLTIQQECIVSQLLNDRC
jgi:hypothetical protein